MNVGILGFGEAGPIFARQFVDAGVQVWAFDTQLQDGATKQACAANMARCGIRCAETAVALAQRCDLIISTVTATNAFDAVDSLGRLHGHDIVDLNSVAPATKLRIANLVTRRGATCTTGVAMDTVPQKGAQVPILLSGPDADRMADVLNELGLNARSVGPMIETAAQIKLVRSVFIKGFEAVFAEGMSIAEPLGVWGDVCASLGDTFPSMGWAQIVPYHIERVEVHGARRAAEMRECADMIEAAGRNADLTRAISRKHAQVADQVDQIEAGTKT